METIEEVGAFLDSVDNDMAVLSQTPSLQGVIQARDNNGAAPAAGDDYDDWINQLELVFSAMLREKEYHRLEYIDESSNVLSVVETDSHRHGDDDDDDHDKEDRGQDEVDDDEAEEEAVEKVINVLPVDQIGNQADISYFIETIGLPPGGLYVSPVKLHRENGEIKEPYEPIIQYATPVVNADGQQRGIVVATVFANDFLDELNEEEGQFDGEKATLVNADGYYLAHPDSDKRWGFEFGKDITVASDFSEEIAEQVLDGGSGIIELETHVIAYDTLRPGSDPSGNLVAFAKVPVEGIFASVDRFKLSAALAVLASLTIVLPLAIFRGRQLISLLEGLAADISVSSQQMTSTVSDQERIVNQQAASVNETTTTMDELEASSRHAASQATAAVDAAKHAFAASEEGSTAVGEALEGMLFLEEKVDAIAEKIVDLSTQASQISSVSQLVIDFANQTNMLALNSAVEAVRAEEHGKGFAFVSNEIRKLAAQSQQSADKINKLVSDIQKSITETVMVTEEGTKTVKTGVQIAKRTEATFSDIQESVNQVVLNNQQVSLNLKQQVNAIRQVVDAMEVINKGTRETATGLTQTEEGAERLNEAALGLQQAV
ncbi:MAG: methyl-accepting chemotaxis protein [Cyanobacteria bacterium P01_H01_bin.105]